MPLGAWELNLETGRQFVAGQVLQMTSYIKRQTNRELYCATPLGHHAGTKGIYQNDESGRPWLCAEKSNRQAVLGGLASVRITSKHFGGTELTKPKI